MARSKRSPRERIERAFHVSFLLPAQAAELLDEYAAQVREETLAEAVAVIHRLPSLPAAGADQHWYRFGQNRAATALLAARTSKED
ncbi:hypothetical protein [Kitasatospora sp. NPDC086791]|uniref:hypothetical protein n=1 Tax=Kitasatospora sp. NPDC086791 TaxID=3155178 RepID=UPI0034466D04